MRQRSAGSELRQPQSGGDQLRHPSMTGRGEVADIAVFALGFVWFAFFAQMSNGTVGPGMAFAFEWGVAPFVLGDLLKIALAALAVPAIWSLVDRRA